MFDLHCVIEVYGLIISYLALSLASARFGFYISCDWL